MSFDIVVPVGPNDLQIIEKQLLYTKKNIIDYRNIYLICCHENLNIDGCITVNENIFPFNINTVSNFHGKNWRNGWYLQQLLKLYAGNVVADILPRYLVIDCDTFFLKPTRFIEDDKCLYNYGSEYHTPYFEHMYKMDKDFIKMDQHKSGISHHMMFETHYLNEIFKKVEKNHNDVFYNVFLKLVEPTHITESGASEYELYFNYIYKNHNDKIKIRELKWKNCSHLSTDEELHYISCHWYMRK